MVSARRVEDLKHRVSSNIQIACVKLGPIEQADQIDVQGFVTKMHGLTFVVRVSICRVEDFR
jgi:hypothetical protein